MIKARSASSTLRTDNTFVEDLSPHEIARKHAEVLSNLHGIIHHPRSLARPTPSWRPPTKDLPATRSGPKLTVAITRHRVGPLAQARIRGYGETRIPAYLVSIRVTDKSGLPVDPQVSEAWIRALLYREHDGNIHEISTHSSMTYVWIVDGKFNPLQSPGSLFEGLAAA
ncbi:hypothetical protein QP027_04110 [Corynebacterium breve]|uniref:Uncharacterized protein n=1 Tax=Corynebacterium breve TaxID=3049799 RepID=A0ABY8VK61_9CORY|nr:hypothetical protein [Corynebacterium breve]WIM68584.1 hypothetical protein QP027_04110 [Corynebacterium breve]